MRSRGAIALLISLWVGSSSPAFGAVVASQTTPDGVLKVDISVGEEKRAFYSVSRRGRPVIDASRMGFLLSDAPKIERNFALVFQATDNHDETCRAGRQTWGMTK